MKKHLSRWGAIWVLVALWLGSWAGHFFTQLDEVTQTAKDHGEQFLWADFWPHFLATTFENWQSEFLQLAVQAVLIGSIIGQPRLFRADFNADKEDVDKILKAIKEKK